MKLPLSRFAGFSLCSILSISTILMLLQEPLQSTEPAAPGGIEWKLTVVQDEDGDWWNSFRIVTVPGVGYDIQTNDNLVDTWETVASYYGTGAEVIHPLFPGHEPAQPPPAGQVTLPSATSSPLRITFALIERTSAGEVVLSWQSLSNSGLVRHTLTGVTLDPVWEEFQSGYINIHGDYMMALNPRLQSPVIDPGASTLSVEDQAFVTAFTSALPQITDNLTASVANAALALPPPPPDPNAKKFFRIRADWAVDSDGDGRFDWQELLMDGNSPFNPDTDGDGTDDAHDLPILLGAPTPDEPARPPVAKFEHRHVIGSRDEVMTGSHAGVSGYGYRSDGQTWLNQTAEHDSLIQSQTFEDLTEAAEALPIESPWIAGVASVEAVNLEDHDNLGTVTRKEWTNFKTEYRLTLPEAAPAGGYSIPLTFAKLYYDWNDSTNVWTPSTPGAGESASVTLALVIPEDETESDTVTVPSFADLGINRRVTLVPADIAILEGSGDLPPDGLCVQMDETFKLDFNGKDSPAEDCLIPDEWITWETRGLNADGSFDDWKTITLLNLTTPVRGCEISAQKWAFGCFQARAVISNGSAVIPIKAVRMRDATNAIDGENVKNVRLIAGTEEYLGVADQQISEDIRDKAVIWLGSTAYAQAADIKIDPDPGEMFNPSLITASKCNVFVTHVSWSAGANTPLFYRWNLIPSAPMAREDWFFEPEDNVDLDGPGWRNRGIDATPRPGAVVADNGMGKSGHCGILDYDGSWISAGSLTVNKAIHLTDPPRPSGRVYKPFRLRSRTIPGLDQ